MSEYILNNHTDYMLFMHIFMYISFWGQKWHPFSDWPIYACVCVCVCVCVCIGISYIDKYILMS